MARNLIALGRIIGRNGADAPHLVPDDQCCEAVDVEFTEGGIAKKRNGTAAHGTTSYISGVAAGLWKHVPGSDQTAAEMWVMESALGPTIKRLAAGTTWSTISPSPADTFSTASAINQISTVTFNGKSFVAANSDVNRLHVWDGTNLRRVGIAPMGTPTATTSAGAVTDSRKYKTAAVVVSSGVVTQRSELSTASSVVSMTAQRATVTRVSPPGEGETHWELYVASDDDNYATYRLHSQTAIATTTVQDNEADLTTLTTFEPLAGRNQLPPSAKYLVTDGNRLLMAGAWESSTGTGETTPKNNRVWFTPALGSTSAVFQDDERISNTTDFKSWVDVGENDGDTIVGLGVLNGIVHAFKNDRLYRLRPTGDGTVPYLVEEVSKSVGAVSHASIEPGEDADGNAALYFWTRRGPYRLGARGLEYIGRDIEDIITQPSASSDRWEWALFYPAKRQVWFYLPGTTQFAVFDVRSHRDGRGGWSLFTYTDTFQSPKGVMFANTLGASMSLDLKPWIAREKTNSDPDLQKFDTGTFTGTAYVHSKAYAPTQFKDIFTVRPATLIAETSSGVSVRLSLYADYHGTADVTGDVTLTAGTGLGVGSSGAASTESRIVKRYDSVELSGMRAVQVRLGDPSSTASAWTLDHLTIPVEVP